MPPTFVRLKPCLQQNNAECGIQNAEVTKTVICDRDSCDKNNAEVTDNYATARSLHSRFTLP